jgi:signal transduction histidine kinase
MEAVRQLVLVYSGVIVINLALSAVFWLRYRTLLHRNLFLVWASSIVAALAQALPATNQLALALMLGPTFLVGLSLASLLARIAGLRLPSRLYWSTLGVGVVLATLAHISLGRFSITALPVSIAVALPLLDTPLRALLTKSAEITMPAKAAALSCMAYGIHNLDYPFLRDKPQFALGAFSVALLVIFAVSITAPATVLERVTQERTKIDELNQFQRRFFANVTHELRTPLTMILAPLESILTGDFGPLTPTQRSYLEANYRNGLRLLRLINDLLDLAKLEEGFLRLRAAKADVRTLLQDVVAFAQPLAARKDLRLDLRIERVPEDLHLDSEKMERVFVNLISNALKFTETGGVSIALETSDGKVTIAIEDTGIGIAAENLSHIFERFNQGDGSVTRRFGGTGIGLAYAKEIVELHGGQITVESTLGKGSRFVVHLEEGADRIPEKVRDRRLARAAEATPKRKDDQEPREWAHRLQRQNDYRFAEIGDVTDRRLVPRGGAPALGARVLVVEDNVEILELVNLQFRDKYNVYVAQNGREGLDIARRERPDLIVTDFMMPEMDGLTMIRTLREDPAMADIPVIMLTAKTHLDDRLSARDAGADIYLNKPFSPRELESTMRQLLERRGRHVQNIIRAHVEGLEVVSAGLAHEIHNPLTFIKNAHLLISENLAKLQHGLSGLEGASSDKMASIDKARVKIDRMVESAGKGIHRIEQVVDLVRRYAREGYPSEPSEMRLDEAVADVTALVAPKGEVDCDITLELRAGDRVVRCIPEEMHQVIRSLVQNAVDAVGPGGKIHLRTRAEDKHLIFESTDNGPGIEQENLTRIFSPFFTTKAGSGRGLGLAIVQIVVSRAGGSVEVTSSPNVETTFRVRLPTLGHASSDALAKLRPLEEREVGTVVEPRAPVERTQ